MRKLFLITALSLLGLTRGPGLAGGEATPAPADESWTVITCDGNLYLDYKANQASFYNNVVVKNPRGMIKADRLVVFFSADGKGVERTEAIGNVSVRMGARTGSSKKFVYYPAEKRAVMIGDAVVSEGPTSVRGGKITFYLDRKEMEVEDIPGGEFQPGEDYDINF